MIKMYIIININTFFLCNHKTENITIFFFFTSEKQLFFKKLYIYIPRIYSHIKNSNTIT